MTKLYAVWFVALASVTGCSKQVSVQTPEPPPPAPEPVAEPEPEPEEEEPVVAEEPKNLDIQRDVIRLKPGIKILFATNSDALMPESHEILDEVVSVFEQNARLRVRVEGHTDGDGDDKYNLDLSARRAASVMKYLVDKGVASERLESHGCGEATPLGDNATEDGKQMNRRVEFVILRRRRVVEPCRVYKPGERRRWRGARGDGGAAPSDASAPAPDATTPTP